MKPLAIDTPFGIANAHLNNADEPRAALILGHGAGGGVQAKDLVAVARVAHSVGLSVALVEQPYRVAGRRSPAPAHQLDAVWTAVIDQLLAGELHGLRLLVGGRSSGARVACRTAGATGAVGVLCLAFPLQPPRRSSVPATGGRRDRARRQGHPRDGGARLSSPREVSTSSQVVQTWFNSRSPNSMLGLMRSRFQNCVRDWKITRESK